MAMQIVESSTVQYRASPGRFTAAAAPATQSNGKAVSLHSAWDQWQTDGRKFWQQMDSLVETLDGLAPTQRQ